MSRFDRRRLEFGDRLRHHRENTGRSSRQFAEDLGWPPSKVSKLEKGRQTATDSDVTEWCQATGAPESVTSELLEALLDLRVEYTTWRRELRSGYQQRQQRDAKDEQSAAVIRAVDFGVVPGLLQIPDYARRVFMLHAELQGTELDVEAAVAARMARQSVLWDTSKTIEILVAEAALRYPVASPETMVAQIDRLKTMIGLRTVRFGVLPLNRQMPWMPMHGFWILDDQVLVENITAEIRITDPTEVAIYGALTERLWQVAAEGADARALLERITADSTNG